MALGLGLSLLLAACSGGTGGDTGSGPGGGSPVPGVLQVAVSDTFGAAVAGATVRGVLNGVAVTGTTDAQGLARLAVVWPTGTADIGVTRETFVQAALTAPVTEGAVNSVAVTLARTTAPAGGFLATRSAVLPSLDAPRTRLTFEVELIVVNGAAASVDGLAAGDFALQPCTPDPAVDGAECLRSTAGDQGYAPVAAAPSAIEVIPGGVERAYAAALLMDQSGSIIDSDPTGARLFAAKALLSTLGPSDQALLAAFAAPPGALIPATPLTTYPPFRGQASAGGYFGELDGLAPLVGGNTPLYASIDALVAQVVGDPALPGGLARALVVFTDGEDNQCPDPAQCRVARDATIANAVASQVRLFTIGLSDRVDIEALGELAQGTGGALLFAETAEQLLPLYGTVGRLLSLSLPTYRLRWSVDALGAGSFPSGSLLKGRVRVTAGGATFDVPFVVGIP